MPATRPASRPRGALPARSRAASAAADRHGALFVSLAVFGGYSGAGSYSARTAYAGPVANWRRGRWSLSGAVQFATTSLDLDGPEIGGLFDRRIEDADGLDDYAIAHVMIGLRTSSGNVLQLGAVCPSCERVDPDGRALSSCLPMLGILFRRGRPVP